MVEMICNMGYTPIIAHPERNGGVRRDINALKPFLDMGCLTQLTAMSLTRSKSNASARTAEMLMERGWIHFIASDGHGFYRRQPVLSDGLQVAAGLIGVEKAERMCVEHPRALLKGEMPCWDG
ncbi:MAG: hypothetical protein HQL53_01530 [Magnetococcales bacterium]|nr:hypothetical protein [Magnetococcales bacterium]